MGAAETVFDGIVASWNEIGPHFGNRVDRDVIDTEAPYELGNIRDFLLMRFWGEDSFGKPGAVDVDADLVVG
jgi:hypothetical protein